MSKKLTAEEIKSELSKVTDGTHGRHFEFTKKDGSNRECYGTLCKELIPKSDQPKGNGAICTDTDMVRYYDTEKNGWRSFRAEQFGRFLDKPKDDPNAHLVG